MITVIAKLTAAEGKAAEMQAALEAQVQAVDAHEPQVLEYSLYAAEDQEGVFYFVERYPDAEVLATHGQTEHMKALGAALRGGLSAGRAEVVRVRPVRGIKR